MDAGGGNVEQLTGPELGWRGAFAVTWSPDGRRLAFTRYVELFPPRPGIFLIDSDGRNYLKLTPDEVDGSWPAWSPDGSRIAFVGDLEHGVFGRDEIFVISVDGSGLRKLTEMRDLTNIPAWSPDGARIVYESGGDLYIVSADGGEAQLVVELNGVAVDPAWAPGK